MKNFLLSIIILLTAIHNSHAQTQYVVLIDSTHDNAKIFKGIINKRGLTGEPTFKWYAESQRIYPHPDTSAVAAFKNNADKIYFIIFAGTWCEDTHFVLPKFFKIQEA